MDIPAALWPFLSVLAIAIGIFGPIWGMHAFIQYKDRHPKSDAAFFHKSKHEGELHHH